MGQRVKISDLIQLNVTFIKGAFIDLCIIVGGGNVSEVNNNEVPHERTLRMVIAKKCLGIDNPELLEFTANEVTCCTLPASIIDTNMDPHYVGKDMFGRIEPLNDSDRKDVTELQVECKTKQPELNINLSVRSIADQIDVILRPDTGRPKTRKYCIDWRTY